MNNSLNDTIHRNGETKSSTNGTLKLVKEIYGGELYAYYPLGQYIVAAPGVCGGRPTFKHTRLQVAMVLAMLANGSTIEEIVEDYLLEEVSVAAIREAIQLASSLLTQFAPQLQLETA